MTKQVDKKSLRINLSDTSDSDVDLRKNKPPTPVSSKDDTSSIKSKSSSIISKLKSAFGKARSPSPAEKSKTSNTKSDKKIPQKSVSSSDEENSNRSINDGRKSRNNDQVLSTPHKFNFPKLKLIVF